MSSGHAERVEGLLRRIGRLLSLATTTVIEVATPTPPALGLLLKQFGNDFAQLLGAAAATAQLSVRVTAVSTATTPIVEPYLYTCLLCGRGITSYVFTTRTITPLIDR